MERSARFLSLSGWSGIWAGMTGLAGAYIAHIWLRALPDSYYNTFREAPASISTDEYNAIVTKFIILALAVFIIALAGGYYFTWLKAKKQGVALWNAASRKMLFHIAVPIAVGGLFALHFLIHQHEAYIAPICLAFYGLALINGSKYTLSDIHYLGLLEIALAGICLFMPGYGLTFWAVGFGALHILYGIIVWNKYDKRSIGQ